MPEHKPPRPRANPGLGAVVEVNAATGPHTVPPQPSFDARSTLRPQPSNPPPEDIVSPLPTAKPLERKPTQRGMPAPPSDPPRDSGLISAGALAEELAAQSLRRQAAEAGKQEAEAEAAELRRRLQNLAAAAPADPAPTRGQWQALAYKLAAAVVSVVVAAAAFIAYRLYALEPRVDNTEARVSAVKTRADTGRDVQKETLVFLAAWQAYQDCINGQEASATVRGTGHKLTSVPEVETLWGEQNRPPNRPAPLWPTWTWFTIKDCGAEPHVPTLPP